MALPHWLKPVRDKLGHDLLLIPGVSAMIFNAAGEILLQRRSDTGRWATIGGVQEPGEEPADAIAREVREETGLDVEPVALTGVYVTPVVTYPNGDQVQYTTIQFLCRPTDPNAVPHINDDESLELKFFPVDALPELRSDMAVRVHDAAKFQGGATGFRFRGQWRA
jgi:8-oxo-dGTP pyrophosphatase MutT (NUDIX family)